MYNQELENLISAALVDGELTEKEKQILFKRAQSMGIDLDEFEMVLDSRLALLEKEKKAAEVSAAPMSNKFGDIRKCPACGAILQSFQTTCPDCGHEFRNIESVQSAQKLFDQLQAVELRKGEKISNHEAEKQRRLDDLSRRHNSDGALVKIFGGEKRQALQDEEREDLIRELNKGLAAIERDALSEKRNIIKNFPVPNAKEDLMELLAMATSNAYDNDGVIGPEEEVWIQKTDQVYQKIVVCSANDKTFLLQATNMIVSLMKKLPQRYKNFTQIPQSISAKVKEDLQREKEEKKRMKLAVLKKWGLYGGICLLICILFFIIAIVADAPLLLLGVILSIIGLVVICNLAKRDYNQANNLF